MSKFLQNLDLRKVFQVMVALVIVLLVAITALGAKQYFLYQHCRQAVSLSDQLLFGFTSIKEHISETLLTGGSVNIQELSREIQGFDEQIKKIGDDILIPEEFKASFISHVDLVSLVVQLRAVQGSEKATPQQLGTLTASLRSVGGRLLQFHEVLSAYTQSLLLGLHRVMVGTLALVVFVVSFMLFFMHRNISDPILLLHKTACAAAYGDDEERERCSVRASIEDLRRLILDTAHEKQRLDNLLTGLNNVLETLPDNLKEDTEFWETLCQALQTNPDYLLVWVGHPASENEYPRPVTGCGCVTSSSVSCTQAIQQLITYCRQDGSLCDSARQAVSGKRIVVENIPVTSMPDTLRASLPFSRTTLRCASFPVMRGDKVLAVVTLYSATAGCFAKSEITLLHFFFQQIGMITVHGPGSHLADAADKAGIGVYRFSVIGALTAGLAHEMINTTNGALNYSQALLDLMADDPSFEDGRLLLEKLHKEELKNAGLTEDLTRLAGKSDTRPQKINMSALVERAVHLLSGQFKQDGIKVVIDADDDLPDVSIPDQSVLIVLLTLLQYAAEYMNSMQATDRKVITAVLRAADGTPNLVLTFDNCPSEIVQKKNEENPWPDLSLCSQMLERIGGSLTIGDAGAPGNTICTLILPCN